jgi:hypothetical protein
MFRSYQRLLAAFCVAFIGLGNAVALSQTSNVVIMLDLTGSTSLSDLESAKEATRNLLNTFENLSPKPRVALGSFNNQAGVDPSKAARILTGASLTESYGTSAPASGLYQTLNSLPNPVGYTDIAAALRVAQTELELNATSGARYIVLVTDGTANRPGGNSYGGCGACGCENADASAKTAATEIRNKGTRILVIHYAGTSNIVECEGEPKKGLDFLKFELLSNQSDLFESSQALTPIFGKIACAVGCSDDDPCTIDSCDEVSGVCSFTPNTNDTDQDGILDCSDSCRGNNALLGTSCSVPQGSCSIAGTYECGATGEVICATNGTIASGCCAFSQVDVSSSLSKIRKKRKTLRKSLKRGKRTLKQLNVNVGRLFKAYTAAQKAANIAEASLPTSFLQCNDALTISACPSFDEAVNYKLLSDEATQAQKLAKKLVKKLKREKHSGALTSKTLKVLKSVKKAGNILKTELLNLPATRNTCL